MSNFHSYDLIIIGSGAAGLSLALRLPSKIRIAILSKGPLKESSTLYAQGGIAAVLDPNDSVESHVSDTLKAGAGLCKQSAVQYTVENSRAAIEWLISQGVEFSTQEKGPNKYHLTQEGGHSQRRIIHSADATGKAVETNLEKQVQNSSHIDIYEHYNVIDIITSHKLKKSSSQNKCLGAYALNLKSGEVETFMSPMVSLATGGASKVYLYTSNPDIASGDGIAIAWRAGCRVANLQFNQFHPTCLFHPHAKSFLISEAVRGEGGVLLRPDGSRFMPEFDPRAELAPRDIVARAIDHEIKRLGVDCVFLDISHKPASFIEKHFPTIMKQCKKFGIDMAKQPIPVVPAAHYTCGGVVVDLNSRTDVEGLYAIGEVACTGLHGANRMASNSLLECLVFAKSAAEDIEKNFAHIKPINFQIPDWDESQVTDSDEEVVVSHNWHELRRLMWNYVGIVRTNKRLERAKRRINLLQQEIQDYYANFKVSNDLLELRNLVLVAELMVACAMERAESRGLHFTLDYPKPDPKLEQVDTILTPIYTG